MAQHSPRLHLIASEGLPHAQVIACAEAACAAGDVASILLPASPPRRRSSACSNWASPSSSLASATLRRPHRADGVEVSDIEAYREARRLLGTDRIIGADCGTSRHRAMELAEAGADYVAFAQGGHEDLISWWSAIFEIPCIAADPVSTEGLDILLPHRPDFIRPDDAMWSSPEAARDIVKGLTARLIR